MSRESLDGPTKARRFPRVSGDEPAAPAVKAIIDGFSPRERE